MRIVQKWVPPKPETQQSRIDAVSLVLRLINDQPISMSVTEALDQISTVKGLFSRVAREDQWDWFFVQRQLG